MREGEIQEEEQVHFRSPWSTPFFILYIYTHTHTHTPLLHAIRKHTHSHTYTHTHLSVKTKLGNLPPDVSKLPLKLIAALDIRDIPTLEGHLFVVELCVCVCVCVCVDEWMNE